MKLKGSLSFWPVKGGTFSATIGREKFLQARGQVGFPVNPAGQEKPRSGWSPGFFLFYDTSLAARWRVDSTANLSDFGREAILAEGFGNRPVGCRWG